MKNSIDTYFSFAARHPLKNLFTNLDTVFKLPDKLGDRSLFSGENCSDGFVHASAHLQGSISICKDAQIGAYATIEGPVFIGQGAKINAYAHIRPGTWIGAGVQIGQGSEIKRSICLDGAKIASGAFVGDSILGFGARVGSGTIFANRRFDQKDVTITSEEGTKYETNQPLIGAIIGDFVRVGANAVLCPGTVIGAYSWVGPGTVLSGVFGGSKLIHARQELIIKEIEKTKLRDKI